MSQYEEPNYSLVATFANFEIRNYERSIMAITQRSSSNYQGSSGGGYRKSSGKDYKAKSVGEDTSVFGQSKDDEIPF